MFDNELKQLYDNIQYKLKSNSETALTDIEQEIVSISKKISTKLSDILSYNGVSVNSYKLDGIVGDYLTNELKQYNKKFLVNNFQRLATFNSSVQSFISEQAKQQIDKSKKEQVVNEMMQKMDYTMTEYKKTSVNLKEQFNTLFQKILRDNPLYDKPQAVEDIKQLLTSEMKAVQEFFRDKRNHIVSTNTTLIVESSKRLSEHTDYLSSVIEQTQQINEQIVKDKEQIDKQVQQIKEQQQVEVQPHQQPINQEQVIYEQPKQTSTSVVDSSISIKEKVDAEEYKTLHAPSFKSAETAIPSQTNEVSQNHRILEDGSIEWQQDPRTNMFTKEDLEIINSQTPAPTLVDNEIRIIDTVKKQMDEHIWKDIGIYASRTDTTIDTISNEMVDEIGMVLQQSGIPNNPNITMQIIKRLNSELKEVNNNLSANMVTTFTNINNATMDSISQTFPLQPEIKEQEVEQCLNVYLQSTQLKGFHLSCSGQFKSVVNDICGQYGIKPNTPQYAEISRIVENKRVQVESQMHNMFNDFSNSNSIFITNTIGSTMLSQQYVQGLQQELTPQQIQILLNYNRQETEKNNFEMKSERDLEQISGMSR